MSTFMERERQAWKRMHDSIAEACSRFPEDHAWATRGALSGLQTAWEERERNIRNKYGALFAWEAFVEKSERLTPATKKTGSLPWLDLSMGYFRTDTGATEVDIEYCEEQFEDELNQINDGDKLEAFQLLVEEIEADPSPPLPHGILVSDIGNTDLPDGVFPLFVRLVNKLKPQQLKLKFIDCTEYIVSVANAFNNNNNKTIMTLEEDFPSFSSSSDRVTPAMHLTQGNLPNWSRFITAPAFCITSLLADKIKPGYKRDEVFSGAFLAQPQLRLQGLEELMIGTTSLCRFRHLALLLSALEPCKLLRSVKLTDVTFSSWRNEEDELVEMNEVDFLKALVQMHQSLETLEFSFPDGTGRHVSPWPLDEDLLNAVLTHPSLTTTTIPMDRGEHLPSHFLLILHYAQSKHCKSLKLGDLICLEKGVEGNVSFAAKKHKNGFQDGEARNQLLQVVPQIRNLTSLTLSTYSEAIFGWFQTTHCAITDMDLSETLIDDWYMDLWLTSTRHCAQLKKVSLSIGVSDFTSLCPAIPLTHVSLSIYDVVGGVKSPLHIMALVLAEQQQLQSLAISCAKLDDNELWASKFDSLKCHPSLRQLQVLVENALDSCRFMCCICRYCLNVNPCLEGLRIGYVIRTSQVPQVWSSSFQRDQLPQFLAMIRFLKKLSISPKRSFNCLGDFVSSLKGNTSLSDITGSDFIGKEKSRFGECEELSKILLRNRLLQHGRDTVTNMKHSSSLLPLPLLPHMLAKLGSRAAEDASALHDFLKSGAANAAFLRK